MWVQHRTTICQLLSIDREYRRSSFWRSNHGSQIDLPRDAESLLLPVERGAMLEPKVADRQRAVRDCVPQVKLQIIASIGRGREILVASFAIGAKI